MNVASSNNKVALITGGAHRLGEAIARQLHQRQVNLIIHCNQSKDAANKLCADLNQQRPKSATLVCCDLSQKGSARKLARLSQPMAGRLDFLVNSAAIFYPTPVGNQAPLSADDWLAFHQLNYQSAKSLIRTFIPQLKKSRGAVVNLIDIYARRGLASHSDYCASKAALLEETKAQALKYAPEVRINSLSPGAILWPEAHAEAKDPNTDAVQQNIIANSALRKLGSANAIAQTVAYLLFDASYTTGSNIAVDGGRQWYI